jgi:hypothetical protein
VFEGFKKWWRSEPTVDTGARGPIPETVPGDWVVLPYRIQEACRVSMATVGAHPDLPEHIREWIADWLSTYNKSLAAYLQDTYGEEIFPIIDGITAMVRSYTDAHHAKESQRERNQQWNEAFQRWEEELNGNPPADPPAAS